MAAEQCDECGASVPPGGRACPHCGYRVDELLIEINPWDPAPSSPEQAETTAEPSSPRRRGLALLGGAAVVAIVVSIIGSMNADDPAADPAPTTTAPSTTASPVTSTQSGPLDIEITAAPTLNWTTGPTLGTGLPLDFLGDGETTYFFASASLDRRASSGLGLAVWRSVDGILWEPIGTVLPESVSVHAITTNDDGFVAAGTDAEGSPTVWTSPDTLTWIPERLAVPADMEGQPFGRLTVAQVNGTTVIAGAHGNLGSTAVEDAVAALTGLDPERFNVPLRTNLSLRTDDSSGPPTITVFGPLGISLAEFSGPELGLDLNLYGGGSFTSAPIEATTWTTVDGEWQIGRLDQIEEVGELRVVDETFRLSGYGFGQRYHRVSTDGIEWTVLPGNELGDVREWGERYVAESDSGFDLRISDSGTEWQALRVSTLLDGSRPNRISLILSHPAALLATSQSYAEFLSEPHKVALPRDGFSLEQRSSRGIPVIALREDDTDHWEVQYYDLNPAWYRADIASETVTFLEPDTGAELVTFTLAELEDFEASMSGDTPTVDSTFLVSTDATAWSVNPSFRLSDETIFFARATAANGKILMAMLVGRAPTPSRFPELEIQLVSADLPS